MSLEGEITTNLDETLKEWPEDPTSVARDVIEKYGSQTKEHHPGGSGTTMNHGSDQFSVLMVLNMTFQMSTSIISSNSLIIMCLRTGRMI